MTLRDAQAVNIFKRYLLFLTGLAIMAFGVAFSIKADLGTSPISSVPYVVSLFTPFTVGTATIVMHCVFIFLQILILRKKYHPIQLMQLPVAFFFGYLTDFGVGGPEDRLSLLLAAVAAVSDRDTAGSRRRQL